MSVRRVPEDETLGRDEAWPRALKRQAGWKVLGPDCISAFWLRAFPSTTDILKGLLWEVMDGKREVPPWLVRGRTTMIKKN